MKPAEYVPQRGDAVWINFNPQRGHEQAGYRPAVVDYMVDEALAASLSEKAVPGDGDTDFWQERLRYLLDYEDAFNDANELFDADETAGLVRGRENFRSLNISGYHSIPYAGERLVKVKWAQIKISKGLEIEVS